MEQFGNKEPEIASLLKYFNPNRQKKTPEISVRNFFCQWYEDLPLCIKPNTEANRIKCVDLLHRTLFYHALDDNYLQKELSNIPETDQTLLSFHEEAIKAELRRSHFQTNSEKSNVLDASASVNINKMEYRSTGQPSSGRGALRGKRGGRGWRGGSGSRGGGRGAHTTPSSSDSSSSDLPNKGAKPKIKCTHCKKFGHRQEDCRHYIALQKSSNNKTSFEEDNEQEECSFGFYKAEIKHELSNIVCNGNVSLVEANTPVSANIANTSTTITSVKAIKDGIIPYDISAKSVDSSTKSESVCVNANLDGVCNTINETKVVVPGSIITTASSDINTSVKVITDTTATETFHKSASVTITPAAQEVVIKAANSNIVKNIMGGVILNDNISCQIELDTAIASCFKEIVSKSKSNLLH